MEDDLNDESNTTEMPVPLKKVQVDVSEEPKLESDEDVNTKAVKVNGDAKIENSDASESSDYDNLVIDEKPLYNRKRKQIPLSPEGGFKGFKRVKSETEDEYEPPTNPYFNESLFELSELHSVDKNCVREGSNEIEETRSNVAIISTAHLKKGKKKKVGSPKLREYAQYLGLQPTVQFKCSRCMLRGFASLALLNEHQVECTGEGPNSPPATTTTTTAPSTNFRVTRKVYLCSVCGTYYENWNLFLHMREIHKRFVCLYCLGMFSQSEKLSLHLVTKHNCVPSQLNTEEDFFHVYKEPCYLMCCECEKVFSEQDNFFGHICCNKTKTVNENKTKNNTNKNRQQLINQKQVNTTQPKGKTFVEHVTGDTVEEQREEPDEPSQVAESTETAAEQTENRSEETDQVTATDNFDTMETTNECDDVEVSQEKGKEEELISDKVSDNDEKKESESEVEEPPESPKFNSPSPQNVVDEDEIDDHQPEPEPEEEDTRKVPKVTLKLRQMQAYLEKEESDDDNDNNSDKLTMEVDTVVADDASSITVDEKENKDPLVNLEPLLNIAGTEVPIVELELEHPLDKFDIQILLQKCLRETIPVCVYCNHARKIAVNGKQLGLHAIAEHRFSAIVNSITAEELIPESFVIRIKESLPELQNLHFNLESATPEEGLTFSHVYECFQCRYVTTVHKELYLHNRKMHAKTILLCIMCKSNFYSYSELICHLCPGVYELNNDITFRCCMCVCDNLPSAFRLMVHLRKRHHACDVCLELCHNQSKLSNHVWKHKLHHLCYRCGIAYRNKPDITKHLFWKHGTESVLCKKCLQKKWPHIYHFCIPPSSFTCEECNLNFTKAVALKVHKRLHREENPHMCTFENCNEKFVSKKLLLKHEFKHREPPEDANKETQSKENLEMQETLVGANHSEQDQTAIAKDENSPEDGEKKTKPRVDVYDLPELNLSESDSDSEEEVPKSEVIKENSGDENPKKSDIVAERVNEPGDTLLADSVPVLDNIWDDFKLYQASKEKIDGGNEPEDELEKTETELPKPAEEERAVVEQHDIVNVVMMDHDYSLLSQEYKTEPKPEGIERSQSMDHDYCSSNNQTDQPQEERLPENIEPPISPPPTEKKERKPSSSSGSSNDSDTSSCTCGSNCSCSSSGSSSSSSDSSDSDSSSSEGRRKQQARRERRKQHAKNKKESETSIVDVVATDNQVPPPSKQHIEESDLDTTETETDEDFYDKQPQKLANKLIAEKRKELMLLAEMGTLTNGAVLESSRPSTPSLPETEALKLKKKSKSKKKKKKKRQGKQLPPLDIGTNYQCQPPIVSPLTISLPKNSPFTTSPSHTTQFLMSNSTADEHMLGEAPNMSDASLRASKRRRIPNKFYGYSSDEEQDKHQPPVFKWRKVDLPSPVRPAPNSPLVVPPITIKPLPPPLPPEELPGRLTNDLRTPQTGFVPPNVHAQQPHVQDDSGSESAESSTDDEQPQPPPLLNRPPNQPPLYCYCRCPYDEVSEMIGCDANDCLIEWFHFECVGIMVPPKGQWFCPDCRKKKQQRKDLALM